MGFNGQSDVPPPSQSFTPSLPLPPRRNSKWMKLCRKFIISSQTPSFYHGLEEKQKLMQSGPLGSAEQCGCLRGRRRRQCQGRAELTTLSMEFIVSIGQTANHLRITLTLWVLWRFPFPLNWTNRRPYQVGSRESLGSL
jgi:hypothetical protein